MKPHPNRTTLALALTVTAIAVPCAAWYLVGSREAARRAAEIEQAPQRLAREATLRLADRLRDRLHTLRENETKRPFYHYQNYYHDPRGAYEGAAVVPSPLAEGPLDPLIRTYFQLDAAGRFTLPQLPDQVQIDTTGEWGDLIQIRRQLELQSPAYVAVANEAGAIAQAAPPTGQSSSSNYDPQSRRVERLDQRAYVQNIAAAEVFQKLRAPQPPAPGARDTLAKYATKDGIVEVSVGPLQWHTIRVNREPSLLALRDVHSPFGRTIQGILIAREGVDDLLRASPLPARFEPGPPVAPTDIAIPLDNTVWHVTVDARLDLAEAYAAAEAVRRGFRRVFAYGVAAASVAGLCLVGLVWQTDRLARQRAQFAASAAHELRTPLAGLRFYSDMLAEGLGDPSRSQRYARRIADETEQLSRVVANVLGFLRRERGALQVHPESGDLAPVVHEAVARHQPALEALGATVCGGDCGRPTAGEVRCRRRRSDPPEPARQRRETHGWRGQSRHSRLCGGGRRGLAWSWYW